MNEVTRELLRKTIIKRISRMKTSNTKKFLLNCIDSNGYIKLNQISYTTETPLNEDFELFYNNDNSSSSENNELVENPDEFVGNSTNSDYQYYSTSSSRTNQVTGRTMGNYIDFGDQTSQLAKRLMVIQTWVSSAGPIEVKLKSANEQFESVLATFFPQLNENLANSIKLLALKVYYNLLNYYILGITKEIGANKGDLSANYLAIIITNAIRYYTSQNLKYEMVLHFIKPNASVKLHKAKKNLVKIFSSDPNYLALISQQSEQKFDNGNLPPELITKAERIINQLTTDNFFGGNISLAGVLYYLGNKFYPHKITIPSTGEQLTLKYLSKHYNLSTTSISNISQKIERYYSMNPDKKKLI